MSAHPAPGAINKSALTNADDLLSLARGVLRTEAEALLDLEPRLGDAFLRAVQLILNSHGRVQTKNLQISSDKSNGISSGMK